MGGIQDTAYGVSPLNVWELENKSRRHGHNSTQIRIILSGIQ